MANEKAKGPVAKRKIGIMHSGSPGNPDHLKTIQALKDALKAAGYDENSNLEIVGPRFADDDLDKLGGIADTFIQQDKVEVLVAAGGTRSADEAQRASAIIQTPVVFTSVAHNSPRPNNMTGVCARTSELDPDRLDLLHQLVPTVTAIGALTNSKRPNFPGVNGEWQKLLTKATSLGFKPADVHQGDVPSPHNPAPGQVDKDIDTAFNGLKNAGVKAVLVTADPIFNNHRKATIKGPNSSKFPAIYQWRQFVDAGGLMSYGTNLLQAYQIAGNYVGLALDKKTSPVQVVVLDPELAINLKTAKAIGVTVPQQLLYRAAYIVK